MAFQFRLTDPKDNSQRLIQLPLGEYTVGQTAKNAIILEHIFVGDVHAQLEVSETAVWLTDLGTPSGTSVDGLRLRPRQAVRLAVGAVVEIGWFPLALEETAVSSADPAEPQLPDPEDKPAPKELLMAEPDYWQTAKPLGFCKNHSRYMQYLPAIYDTPFMHRFLGLFESLLAPIVWRIDNLDFYLDGRTATTPFLPWLANWYCLVFDETWEPEQRRTLLQAAPEIFGSWGTAHALKTVLDIYLEAKVTIVDNETLPPFTFQVNVPQQVDEAKKVAITQLINQHKPAQTSFELHFTG